MKLLGALLGFWGFILPILGGSYDSYNSPYSFDANSTSNPAWMSKFPNSTTLSSLSIPGTHDTMTFDPSHVLLVLQCQNLDLDTQLQAGIRYIDIRCAVVNNELLVYHDPLYTGYPYTEVLQTLFSFLEKNPSETVLMRLKEEEAAINSTMTFEQAFNFYRLNDPTTAAGCAKHFWIPSSPGPTAVPALGQLRGKILIIQDFGSNPAPYGIKYQSPLFVTEDYYQLTGYSDMDNKFNLIQQNLGNASSLAQKDGTVYLTHLSASVGVLPIEAAAGTLSGSVVGENDRTGKWLTNHVGGNGSTGVVIMDFPGKSLIEAVLARNVVA